MWADLKDLFARNRKKVGGAMFVGWLALQIDPAYVDYLKAHSRANTANGIVVAMIGYLTGAGSHDSDQTQKLKQALKKEITGE